MFNPLEFYLAVSAFFKIKQFNQLFPVISSMLENSAVILLSGRVDKEGNCKESKGSRTK